MTFRVIREALDGDLTPQQAVLALRNDERPFALVGDWAGVDAVLGSAPAREARGEQDPFATLDDLPQPEGDEVAPGARIGGGWFGWLGYALGGRVERLPPPPPAPAAIDPWWLGFYDHVVVRDDDGWWFEALWTEQRAAALGERLALWRRRMAHPCDRREVAVGRFTPVAPGGAGHRVAVAECVERIGHGELFQANVCLRLEAPWSGDAADLFAGAVVAARPRFGALFGNQVISLSPERFLRRTDRHVESDPIKGTADDPEQLRESAKDAAEHVMIVDLMRNDLGRVCSYASIKARPSRIEAHANVFHLVSTVAGELRAEATDGDLLRATFPPGSVTGAPKVQAMKTIARLESTARGLYTGAIGYASPLAGLELSVAIRTFEATAERIWIGAGGGIVADSDPDAELAEALAKASGVIEAIGGTLAPGAMGGEESAQYRSRRRSPVGATPRALDLAPRPDPRLGVFETLLSLDGVPQHAVAHLGRLARSLAALYGAELTDDAPGLLAAAAAAVPLGRARVRLEARPDRRGEIVLAADATAVLADPEPPHTLVPYLLPGGFGEHKWTDRRLADALAAAVVPGAAPLLVDGDGLVLETDRANVWIVESGRRLTPPADGRILAGVTRARMLTGHDAEEQEITLERLELADAILLSSSIALVREVAPTLASKRG